MVLWTLIGTLISVSLEGRRLPWVWASVALTCLVTLKPRFHEFLKIPATFVDVSELFTSKQPLDRAKYVGSGRMALFNYGDPVKNDAFAALLGARIPYNEQNRRYYYTQEFILRNESASIK